MFVVTRRALNQLFYRFDHQLDYRQTTQKVKTQNNQECSDGFHYLHSLKCKSGSAQEK